MFRALISCVLFFGLCECAVPQSQTGVPAASKSVAEPHSVEGNGASKTPRFSAGDVAAAQQMTETLGIAEWLGPLAPLALSPFFGVTCLSGISMFGGEWVDEGNPFFGANSPLNNTWVFRCFLILTIVTSVPRLFKVSKPFVQMTDRVESWAGIITMLILKVLVSGDNSAELAVDQVVHLGVVSVTADCLLMIAAALNVLVISSVRFFCEMVIWVIPVPAIDALFETVNKSACATLMMIYGYSPTLATALNLGLFLTAAIVFRWIYRGEFYFRSLLLDAACQKLFPAKKVDPEGLVVFPTEEFEGLPSRARCELRKTESGWKIVQKRLLGSSLVVELSKQDWQLKLSDRILYSRLVCDRDDQQVALIVTRRYHHLLTELCDLYGIRHEGSRRTSDDGTFDLLPRLR